MRIQILLLLLVLSAPSLLFSQKYIISELAEDHIVIECNFNNSYAYSDTLMSGKIYRKISGEGSGLREAGEPWLPIYNLSIGIPFDSDPSITIVKAEQELITNVLIPPVPSEDPVLYPFDVNNVNKEIYSDNALFPAAKAELSEDYVMRYSRILPVVVSPFQYNPVKRELVFNKIVIVRVEYNRNFISSIQANDYFSADYLKSTVVNPEQAMQFIGKPVQNTPLDTTYWYNPSKNWFKIFLKEKGVYRITFDYLVSSGVDLGTGVASNKLELYNEGQKIPIDIIDDGDSVFNEGDYFQFVGFPPSPSDYSKLNIYNLSNVYWFSYECEDSSGLRYQARSGYPQNYDTTFTHSLTTVHFEKDSMFERFGHASNSLRDYWQWGKAYKQGPNIIQGFEVGFEGLKEIDIEFSHIVKLRLNMHGLTTSIYCSKDHRAEIELTGQQVGSVEWDGQNAVTYEKDLYISEDSLHIYPLGNTLTVWVKGNNCGSESDEIRVNWFELDYWRYNRTGPETFDFKNSMPFSGVNRYWLVSWPHDTMKIYIPNRNILISDPYILHDEARSVLFVDTVFGQSEYFCISDSFYFLPDSIKQDSPSSLRSLSNGADYLIIAHRDFKKIADDLVTLRSSGFPDEQILNPRIKLVYIDEIFDEFSYGLLNPIAVKDFLKYTFEKWVSPAPLYVVLIGDMSFDYRRISPDSRPSFIPSIGYHSIEYGLAASDNMFVAVSGSDVTPDMAIGRISIENVQEGEVLLDKLRNYPNDQTKEWKQNVLLLASGLSEEDENKFGFNDASMLINNRYLLPGGYSSRKIFRYPNRPEYIPYKGEGPQIRKGINEGATIVNYYGHGGGYQWDLVFLNDDIYMLENGGRLPVVSSVTCYTAHFDNQNVFGEQFIKVPGKGAIGFWGSSGVTLWGIGDYINQLFFKEVFSNREYVVGKAILKAKKQVYSGGYYASQIALLTYLGDPVMKIALPTLPDFLVKSGDITISPEQPLANDTVVVSAALRNLGITNAGDSVNVELSAVSSDTSYIIGIQKIESFGEYDTLSYYWVPDLGGLYQLTVKINESNPIPEADHSDNIASSSFAVFDLSEPNIIRPLNGMTTPGRTIEFLIPDIGYFLDFDLTYVIEIDSVPGFNSPAKTVFGNLIPKDGYLKWTSPEIDYSPCFWRSRIINHGDSSRWSQPRYFIINKSESGYYVDGKTMNFLPHYNLLFSEADSALILNTSKLPPRPDNSKFVEAFDIPVDIADSIKSTVISTDGKYFYVGNIWYYSLTPYNPEGKSYIFKIGTGNQGTVKGQFYGAVPNFFDKILNQFFCYPDGNLYVATGNPYYLRRINLTSGTVDSVYIEAGILDWESATPKTGAYYLCTDGELVYNLSVFDSSGNPKHVLRIFDPNNNWNVTGQDLRLSGSSYGNSFCSFFVYDNYLFTYENYESGFMRKYNLNDGFFEDEWITFLPFQGFYAWVADKTENKVYASVAYGSNTPKIFSFIGNYVDAQGDLLIPEIGPASRWSGINYSLINSPGGSSQCILYGLNKVTSRWDTLNTSVPEYLDLSELKTEDYPFLKAEFKLVDSSFTITEPIRLKDFNLVYTSLPEVQISNKYMTFGPDSLLQGFPITMKMNIPNFGYATAENVKVDFFLDGDDSVFISRTVNIEPDSAAQIEYEFNTSFLSPATIHKMKVTTQMDKPEFYTFNNIAGNQFMVARDSINPLFKLTIDGKEILNGDIVSAKPEILISLKDNGPLPLRKEDFTIVYNNVPLKLDTGTVEYSYTPYPNSEASIKWNPVLKDGRHSLEVLAKDPSGNFFDTTSAKVIFYVYNDFDIKYVYNYPNPFQSSTYFTFELRGDDKNMESFRIKVYTIAGRLIRDIEVDPTSLKAGFNRIYWDGKDQDGDDIANGVYFYKIITRNNGTTKTVTQKLARIR